MSVRLPLQTVLDYNNTTVQSAGPTSVAGGLSKPFFIPQDTDNVVVKFSASVKAGGASALFQTSDDGGVTWYDVARTSVVSAGTPLPEWLSIPVINAGTAPVVGSVVAVGSVVTTGGGAIGTANASTLALKSYSGLPILGIQNRIFIQYTSGVTSILSERVQVYVNNQSNRA